MKAMRSLFFVLSAASACFADPGVKRNVRLIGRTFTVIFALLFVIAEVMDLVT
jgi:hypothetical protein